METISDIFVLSAKLERVHYISPNASLDEGIKKMCCENVDYLVVTDDSKSLIGVITQSNITKYFAFHRDSFDDTAVSQLMTMHLPAVSTSDSLEECLSLMEHHQCHVLPVFDGHLFKGMILMKDLTKACLCRKSKKITESQKIYQDYY